MRIIDFSVNIVIMCFEREILKPMSADVSPPIAAFATADTCGGAVCGIAVSDELLTRNAIVITNIGDRNDDFM